MGTKFEVSNTGQVELQVGSAAAPSLSFLGDLDTGVYHSNPNQLSVSLNGAASVNFTTSSIRPAINGALTLGETGNNYANIYMLSATAALPAYTFGGDNDTGIYSPGANRLGFSTGGVEQWEVTSAGDLSVVSSTQQLLIADGTATDPGITFANDPNTGLYRIGTDILGLATNGTEAIRIDASQNVGFGGAPVTNGLLTLTSTTKAFVPPRMTTTQRDLISSPSNGMFIFNTTSGLLNYYSGSWQDVATGGGISYPLLAPGGSASAPSYSFSGDANTGMYSNGADTLNFVTGGNEGISIDSSYVVRMQKFRAMPQIGIDGYAHIVMQVDSDASHKWEIVASGASGNPLTFTNWGFANSTTLNSQQQLTIGDTLTLYTGTGSVAIFKTPTISGARTYTLPDVASSDFVMTAGAQTIAGSKYFSTQQTFINGNASTPSIAWNSETNSGFYQVTGGLWGATTQGTVSTFFSVNGLQANTGTVSEPGYTFAADTDTGMRRSAANTISLVAGATDICEVRTAGIRPAADNTLDNGESGRRWANVWGTTIHAGDIKLENDWRIIEGNKIGYPEEGVMFLSPEGKKFKIAMTEVE